VVALEVNTFWRRSHESRNAGMRILAKTSIDAFLDLNFAEAIGVFRILLLGGAMPLQNAVAIISTNSNMACSSTG